MLAELVQYRERSNLIFPATSIPNLSGDTWGGLANATLTVNDAGVTAPDGTQTATRMTETSANNVHRIAINTGTVAPFLANQINTFSVYAKAGLTGTDRYLRINFSGEVSASGQAEGANFDLINGTVAGVTATAPAGHGIEAAGNGWYRCWVSVNVGASPNAAVAVLGMENAPTPGSGFYVGDTNASVLLWGAQVEHTAGPPSSLIYTTTAPVTVYEAVIAAPVDLRAGTAYTARLQLGDGSFASADVLDDGITTTVLSLDGSLSPAPLAGSLVAIVPDNAVALTYDALVLIAEPFDAALPIDLDGFPPPFGTTPWCIPEYTQIGGTVEIYLSDVGFLSQPDDEPANTNFKGALTQPFNFEVRLFSGTEPSGQSSVGYGEVVLDNGRGEFDDLLQFGWAGGTAFRLYRASKRHHRGGRVSHSALADAPLVFSGKTDTLTSGEETIRFRLRDRQVDFDVPLQITTYEGTGGTEGGDDLAGKRKPVGYGRLRNVPAILIDAANLVFQLHDGQIQQVDAVRDKGVALAFSANYADYAALIGATIATGAYGTCLAEGLIRLGGANEGLVTVDFRGHAAGGYVETTGEIARLWATTRLAANNFADPDEIDTDAFDTIAANQPAPIGYWQGPDSSVTVGQALTHIMTAVGGWWTVTLDGLFSVGILYDPADSASEDTLTRADMTAGTELQYVQPAQTWRVICGYERMWAVQSQDALAGAVSSADKLTYSTEYRNSTPAVDNGVRARNRNARDLFVPSFFAVKADADAEAERLLALHGTERGVFAQQVEKDPFDIPGGRLGSTVTLTDWSRQLWGNSKPFRLIGIQADRASGQTTWILWG